MNRSTNAKKPGKRRRSAHHNIERAFLDGDAVKAHHVVDGVPGGKRTAHNAVLAFARRSAEGHLPFPEDILPTDEPQGTEAPHADSNHPQAGENAVWGP